MIPAPEPREVHRGFVAVGDREVHYRRVGVGPPALFLHSSPTNSAFLLPDMLAQADRFTCFAPDTPGFGLSDPLLGDPLTVTDLADATAETMAALGLPPVPVFGTHTGAAIALELGSRHPDRVTGLVLDGVPIFTRGEVKALGERHFQLLTMDPLGGHYASTWTRFRDQYRWFPWFARHPDAIIDADLGTPESIHCWVEMFYDAAAHYRPAYRAATSYCEDAISAAAGLRVPAVFTAAPTDMLHAHLLRLPALRADQKIVEIGTGCDAKQKLTRRAFEGFADPASSAPRHVPELRLDGRLRRQFVMIGGRALMIRYAGRAGTTPLILLHDAPGSSRMVEDRIGALADDHLVIAPDIPGSGESEGLAEAAELADYAEAIWAACDALGLGMVAIEGRGFGASLAIEMALARPAQCRNLAIDSLFLPDPAERSAMRTQYAPAITIEPDGAHWYRLWLRLRDSLVYWPWYDTRRCAARRIVADFAPDMLHDWTVEVMKQWATQHHFIEAAMRHDAAARLTALPVAPSIIADSASPFASAFGARLAALLQTHHQIIPEGVPA